MRLSRPSQLNRGNAEIVYRATLAIPIFKKTTWNSTTLVWYNLNEIW